MQQRTMPRACHVTGAMRAGNGRCSLLLYHADLTTPFESSFFDLFRRSEPLEAEVLVEIMMGNIMFAQCVLIDFSICNQGGVVPFNQTSEAMRARGAISQKAMGEDQNKTGDECRDHWGGTVNRPR